VAKVVNEQSRATSARRAATSRSRDGAGSLTVSRPIQTWTGCSCKEKKNVEKTIKVPVATTNAIERVHEKYALTIL